MPLFTFFIIHEYTLSVCIWSRHLKVYSRKWSLIQMSLKKHSLYNLNWSCFEHRVAYANKLCRVVLQLLWLCKIIEKSVMGESFFLSYETWSSTWFLIHAGIKNCESSRELRLAVDCQLSFERYRNRGFTDFQRLIHKKLPGPLQNLPPSAVVCWSPLT